MHRFAKTLAASFFQTFTQLCPASHKHKRSKRRSLHFLSPKASSLKPDQLGVYVTNSSQKLLLIRRARCSCNQVRESGTPIIKLYKNEQISARQSAETKETARVSFLTIHFLKCISKQPENARVKDGTCVLETG